MKVREVIGLVEQDGWFLVATRGSHRQYKHLLKAGRVTIAGKPGDDVAPGTLNSILKQAELKEQQWMRYAIVIEKANANYSAYVPDLPGCIATGATVDAVEREISQAIRFHIEGLKADGLPVPSPAAIADYVEA